MTRFHTRSISALALALALVPTFAQSNVDIGLNHTSDGMLEVKVRPTADFDGIFSSVVFALRWDKNSGITLGTAVPAQAASYIHTSLSGPVREDGMFDYQVFAGFGYDPIHVSGTTWEAGKEYTILSVPVTGKGAVELVNDQWTSEVKNNADYFVSLGGADRTGNIYKGMITTTDLEGTVAIQPNPNEGRFTFSFISMDANDIRVEVMNTLGQSVFHDNLIGFEGTYRKDMDLTTMSDGIYYLKIVRGDKVSVHKIVYH